MEHAGEVEVDDAAPFLDGVVVDRGEVAAARVVVEQRQAAELLVGVGNCGCERREVGDVGGIRQPVDLFRNCVGVVAVDVDDRDPGTGLGHTPARRRADPGTAAGHDRTVPTEQRHRLTLTAILTGSPGAWLSWLEHLHDAQGVGGSSPSAPTRTTTSGAEMADLDWLVADCRAAARESDGRGAIRETLDRAVTDPRLTSALETASPGLTPLHQSDDLTVLHVVWPPLVDLFPHDHRMWVAIGVYAGREDNAFYRRDGGRLVASNGATLEARDVKVFGADMIHSVSNPNRAYTGAIHVYGGDLFGTPRSQWDRETLEESPSDVQALLSAFADAEARYRATAE